MKQLFVSFFLAFFVLAFSVRATPTDTGALPDYKNWPKSFSITVTEQDPQANVPAEQAVVTVHFNASAPKEASEIIAEIRIVSGNNQRHIIQHITIREKGGGDISFTARRYREHNGQLHFIDLYVFTMNQAAFYEEIFLDQAPQA